MRPEASTLVRYLLLITAVASCSACGETTSREGWPPPVRTIQKAPVVSPEASLDSIVVPPGFRVALVASEPLVVDPVAIDIDPDGRLWVVEMRGFMQSLLESEADYQPTGQINVLQDTDDDGRMDKKTVFLDSLVLPRSVLVMDEGVLVGEPPHLWWVRDTDGDLRADEKTAIREDYGTANGNPEGMANSPTWGLDNWIHTTHYPGRLRRTDDSWTFDSTLALGQWGLSMDNYGRVYRNSNANPLRVAMLDPHYYTRNPNMTEAHGADVRIGDNAREVWPIRTTTGVNRGYRESVLREDSTLRTFTAASALSVYRGDRYPDEFQGDVFVPEPAANLVRRFKVLRQDDGNLTAVNAYDEAEFLASTDERFRPVNMYSGPDGTLYVVDMYSGILEHRNYMTQYLKNHILERGLHEPRGLGRIYRVVHTSNPPRADDPQLSDASSEQLIEYLSHPNGWWRDTAQQLIVERRHTDLAPRLRKMVRTADNELSRLHALWTLEGLGEVDAETVRGALSDASPQVRAAAVRIAEPWLQQKEGDLRTEVEGLIDDPSPDVRLQLAASLGEVTPPAADAAMVSLLSGHASQPYLAEAALTGLGGREVEFLARLIRAEGWGEREEGYADVVQRLSRTIANSEQPRRIDEMLGLIGDHADRPRWQRLAVLEGLEEEVPDARPGTNRFFRVDEQLENLTSLTASSDSAVSEKAGSIAERVVWPGKQGYEAPVRHVLTAEQQQRFEAGKQLYAQVCATCHLSNGQGQEGVAVSLVGSEWVLGQEKDLIRIVLDGKMGETGIMPGMKTKLSDREIAAITTYVRNAWDNEESAISAGLVDEVRSATAARGEPWTAEELRIMQH